MKESKENDWTSEQRTFQQWLALPKKERKPKTIELLAFELDVGPVTLYRWKKLDGFYSEVRKLIKDNLQDDLSEIYAALRREAKSGSFQHIKMALELAGDYVEKQEIIGNFHFTSDEAVQAKNELDEWLINNAQKLNG